MEKVKEEIIVLFHAALLGRTDVLQNAISMIRSTGKLNDKEVAAVISTRRAEDNATPLHIATQYGHTDVIRALLNAGADLSYAPLVGQYADQKPYELASDATKETYHVYMFEQIAMNNHDAIERLLEGGVPADTRDGSQLDDSTLHWAASFGSTKVATVLLLHGCSADILNEEGQSPLHLACKGKHVEVIKLLLDEGAKTSIVDRTERLPQDMLPADSELKALLDHPPVPSMKLHLAFEKAQEEKAAKQQLEMQKRLALRRRSSSSVGAGGHTDAGRAFDGEVHDLDDNDLGFDGIGEDGRVRGEEKELLLIFWPPVKRQQKSSRAPPLVLRNSANLLISVASSEIDMIPLLTWSGLLDVLDAFGFQVQVKRSSSGAKVRLCIDRHICPVPNSYELKVGREQILLTAGDSAGLMYGVYTLIQLLKLHSNGRVDPDTGVTALTVPSIAISDCPDVAQRAVLWSYRQQARTSSARMQAQVELLARLRMNTLYLVIDPTDDRQPQPAENGKPHPQEITSTKVYALDEKCRRHCVDLVPTLVIQSIHQRLPLDALKNFSQKMISLVLVFDRASVAAELRGDAAQTEDPSVLEEGDEESADSRAALAAACITACEHVIKDAHLAGYTTISLACSEWTCQTADPVGMAINAGMNAVERDFATMYPFSLFTKPAVCVQDFVHSISAYSSKVAEACSAVSVFPALMDRDFMYPSLLLKFYTFMAAGFAWNRASLLEMLGDPAGHGFDANIVREVMYLLMFPAKVDMPVATFKAAMDLITGAAYAAEVSSTELFGFHAGGGGSAKHIQRTSSDVSLNGSSAVDAQAGPQSPEPIVLTASLPRHEFAKAEKLLWALLTARDGMAAAAVPSKAEAAACLRVYRRLLQAAHWKPDSLSTKQAPGAGAGLLQFISGKSTVSFGGDIDENAHDPALGLGVETSAQGTVLEVEEVFCTLNLLSALCKALVLAHKTRERKNGHAAGAEEPVTLSLEELFESVSVGTKSDFANSILECLSSCAYLWRRRYEPSLLATFKSANLLLQKPPPGVHDEATHSQDNGQAGRSHSSRGLVALTIREANRRFMLQDGPLIPASAVFRLVTKNIPLPKSVHDFIHRLFAR